MSFVDNDETPEKPPKPAPMTSAERNRRYREKHRDRLNAATREWNRLYPEKRRAHYEANKEAIAAKARERYLANPEGKKASAKRYASTPEAKRRARERVLAKQYGMTYDQYHSMIVAQKGLCAACGGPPNKMGLVVDHCHTTGRVRGLLCSKCNSALGLLDDSLTKVRALARYMKRDEKAVASDDSGNRPAEDPTS